MKILVVDDEKEVTSLVKEVLKTEGHNVLVSNSGKRGIAKAQKDNPDMIFLDIMMPDISGEDVMRIIKSRSDVPIVYLTILGRSELESRADGYIRKPFEISQLIKEVKKMKDRKSKSLNKNTSKR